MSLGAIYTGAAPVGTAELSLPAVRTSAGSSVVTSLEFRAQDTAVSALVFDLQYDPNVLSVTPAIGNAAVAADKVLFYNVLPQPDGKANLRILIFGLNQTAIEDGSLVDLTIEVSANSSPGAYPLEFFDVSLASPEAEAVPFKVHSGRVIQMGQH